MGQDQTEKKYNLKLLDLTAKKDFKGGTSTAKSSSKLLVPESLEEFLNRDSLPIKS